MSEAEVREGAAVRFPPPIIPLIALAAGIAAAWGFGPFPGPLHGAMRYGVGTLLVVAGLGVMGLAIGRFR